MLKRVLILTCLLLSSPTWAQWHNCFESFNSLFSLVEKSTVKNNENALKEASDLEELDAYLEGINFLETQAFSPADSIKSHNKIVKGLLDSEKPLSDTIDENGKVMKGAVTKEQAEILYKDMTSTPCVKNSGPYQRADVAVGYCFGRAIIASMHALKRSVHPGAMRKIWVAGPMKGNWGHHVAFMVRGTEGEWFVIDNVTGLVTHTEWIHRMNTQYKKDQELMFFATRPERFGPKVGYSLNSVNLFNVQNAKWDSFDGDNDFYKGFFKDFFEWFDELEEVESFL